MTIPSPENHTESDLFATTLKQRQLPIPEATAVSFGEMLETEVDYPKGLLDKIAWELHYLDEATFQTGLQSMLDQFSRHVIPPYDTSFINPDGSSKWIYDQLIAAGLPLADRLFIDSAGNMNEGVKQGMLPIIGYHKSRNQVPALQGYNFSVLGTVPTNMATFDDWILSGDHARQIFEWPFLTQAQKTYFVMLASTTGIQYIKKTHPNANIIQTGQSIQPVSATLAEEDLKFLARVSVEKLKKMPQHYASYGETPKQRMARIAEDIGEKFLVWGWHKVPDQIPELIAERLIPPIDPPYRRKDISV